MGFSCGFLGLPNVGKSTLFNALSSAGAEVESYPFCTTDADIGIVEVPDPNLERLSDLFPEKQKVPTKIEFVDIAGLVEGAHQGEGLGNQFLADIRSVDALIHVVRCFGLDGELPLEGSQSPVDNLETIRAELLLKDLETVEQKLGTLSSQDEPSEFYQHLKDSLQRGIAVRELDITGRQRDRIRELSLLTDKPVLYVVNMEQGEDIDKCISQVRDYTEDRNEVLLTINAEIEAEVRELTDDRSERQAYLQEWGIEQSALSELITAGYNLLDLVTYYTVDGPEVRAWTIPRGSKALEAAGQVHSDFADYFVQAEVISVKKLLEIGDWNTARNHGAVRTRGADYEVCDGDVFHFVSGK